MRMMRRDSKDMVQTQLNESLKMIDDLDFGDE